MDNDAWVVVWFVYVTPGRGESETAITTASAEFSSKKAAESGAAEIERLFYDSFRDVEICITCIKK